MKKLLCILLGLSLLAACRPEIDDRFPDIGELDLSNVQILGDGFPGGYSNAGWSADRQQYSFGALFAQQLKAFDDSSFSQPLLNPYDADGFFKLDTLVQSCSFLQPELQYSYHPNDSMTGPYENLSTAGPYNDLTVPYLLANELTTDAASLGNLLFSRLLPPASALTYEDLATSQNPSLSVVSFGYDGVAYYMATGGEAAGFLLSAAELESGLNSLLDVVLTDSKDKAIISNMPQPSNLGILVRNAGPYTVYANCLPDTVVPIYIEDGPGTVREGTTNDWLLAEAMMTLGDTILGVPYGLSPAFPIPDALCMDATELAFIESRVDAYNTSIQNIVISRSISLLDLERLYNNINNGLAVNGRLVTNEFGYGGFFSLDGLYPTPMGNAIIANEIIRQLNHDYKAYIPMLNPLDYPAVKFP